MTKVTLISPYYKRADAVRLTLESIHAQDYDDFEALIWDDGSPDGTFAELQKVQAELGDPRIKVYQHSPNIGFTAGLNDAIARAEGDYIAVFGSGDICRKDRIRKQVDALENNSDARFCATKSTTIDETTGREFSDEYFDKDRIELDDLTPACPFTHGSIMYRKSDLIAKGGYDSIFKWCADWDLFFRLLEDGYGVYLHEDLYSRYARMDGVSFAPKKSVEQIKNKYLVMSLAGLDLTAREAFKDQVRAKGLTEALSARHGDIARDLRARQVKLTLMGRHEAARELGSLIDQEFGSSTKWTIAVAISRLLEKSPLDQDKAIAAARRIKSALS